MIPRKPLSEKLAENTTQVLPSGCVIWTGRVDRDGYGITAMTMEDGCKNRKVHRLVMAEKMGRPVPPDLLVCHRCDVRSCVNPEHLFLGTAKDNVRDMISKGRCDPGPRDNHGSKNPNSKLSESDIKFIRKHHLAGARKGPHCTSSLASRFGVNRTQIQKIARGEQWQR